MTTIRAWLDRQPDLSRRDLQEFIRVILREHGAIDRDSITALACAPRTTVHDAIKTMNDVRRFPTRPNGRGRPRMLFMLVEAND